jgi:unsaturated rhamnogalacturonyl hydrolase
MIDTFIRHYMEAYKGYKGGKWCYEDGCFFKGLADLYRATGKGGYLEALIRQVNAQIKPDGTIVGFDKEAYSLDNLNAGKVLFLLHQKTNDGRYLEALQTLRDQLRSHPRTKEGNFWHKRIYPFQVWLDGLYMAPPFLTQFSLTYEKGESLSDVRMQFANARRLLYDLDLGLYYHGYDETRKLRWADPDTGLSPCFWSRAMGWYLMALVDLCEILTRIQADHDFYAQLLRESADNILRWQQPTGLWMQIMDQPEKSGNYAETSASAMFAYAFLKGRRLNILKDRFHQAGNQAIAGIVSNHLESEEDRWEMGGICGMAGLGDGNGHFAYRDGSYTYYIKEPVVVNDPKGVGPLMMARAEQLMQNHFANTPVFW